MNCFPIIKGLVHPKIKIMSLMTNPLVVPTHVSRVSVTERGSTTEPEDNTMMNKAVVFVIF